MAAGKSVSIYVPQMQQNMYYALEQLAKAQGRSVSDVMAQKLNQVCLSEFTKVHISTGAYLALADGDFDALNYIHLDNGVTIITIKENVSKPRDGSKCIYADKWDEWEQLTGSR